MTTRCLVPLRQMFLADLLPVNLNAPATLSIDHFKSDQTSAATSGSKPRPPPYYVSGPSKHATNIWRRPVLSTVLNEIVLFTTS